METELKTALKELDTQWIREECSGSDFGDKRLNARYKLVLGSISKNSQAPLNQVCESWGETLGAYRFINNERVTVEKLLLPHRECLQERAEGEETVLLVQDTTYYSFDNHHACEGLGLIGTGINRDLEGLIQHSVLGITPEGVPLGIADIQFHTREELVGRGVSRYGRPITEKESYRWIEAVERTKKLFQEEQQVVYVCDSEADIFEVMSCVEQADKKFVIRCRYDRLLEDGGKISSTLKETEPSALLSIDVIGNGSRKARKVDAEVKYARVELSIPNQLKCHGVFSDSSLSVDVVEVKEKEKGSESEDHLHWILLTNVKLRNASKAFDIIQWYTKRWSIEEIHKILKTGCRVEKAQFQTIEGLSNYITMNSIVAWRIYFLVHLLRVAPDENARKILTQNEIDTLEVKINHQRQKKGKKRRFRVKTIRQAVTEIAKLGGFLDRKADPWPGIVVMWRGVASLAIATDTFIACRDVA